MVVRSDFLSFYPEFLGLVVLRRGRSSYVPITFEKSYTLVEVVDSLGASSYEVWFLREGYRGMSVNRWNVIFPSNSEWGYYGWSFDSLAAADRKFRFLVDNFKSRSV